MLEFKKIELTDIDIYNSFIQNSNELSCEYAFVNLLMWQDLYNNEIAICDGQLIIKSKDDGIETFYLPLGDDLQKGINLIKEYKKSKKIDFWAQEGSRFEKFRKLYQNEYVFKEVRDAFDYIYLTTDLAELKGKKYHSKRNHISAFSKKYDWHYEKVTDDNINAVKLCAKEWYAENSDRFDTIMQAEKNGIEIMLDNLENLNICGGAIFIEDRVVAFTLGTSMGKEVFNIHIEKALKEYAGAYAVINQQFAKNELLSYKYINREDDLGIEGLRKAKLSYKPTKLLKKYYCQQVDKL